jgi:hypothetical protein
MDPGDSALQVLFGCTTPVVSVANSSALNGPRAMLLLLF